MRAMTTPMARAMTAPASRNGGPVEVVIAGGGTIAGLRIVIIERTDSFDAPAVSVTITLGV